MSQTVVDAAIHTGPHNDDLLSAIGLAGLHSAILRRHFRRGNKK